MTDLGALREEIRAKSPFGPDATEAVIRARFDAFPRRLRFALSCWPLADGAVLDVGCSYGHCLVHFGAGSVGIDSSPEHVEFCTALGLDARLADANRQLDVVSDRSFDFAWVSDVVEHLDAPRLVLRELARKLKPGGRLILMTTALPSSRLAAALVRRAVYRGFDAEAHHYQFTAATLRFMVERSGYRVVSVTAPHRVPASLSPRLYVEAQPDPDAERLAREAERRNRGGFET